MKTKYKIGDKLTITKREPGEKSKKEVYTVIALYPSCTLMENENGFRWCPSNAELYVMEVENLRKMQRKEGQECL